MTPTEILDKLVKYETYLKESRYQPFVQRARTLYNENNLTAAEEVLTNLPTEKFLLESIVEKLKGKSVYKALQRGLKESTQSPEFLKGLFSLGTHILIECEQGNTEYRMLLPMVYTRIGSLITEA